MTGKTQELWRRQDQHEGDRWRLFQAVGAATRPERVLYPGSYVDVAPSFVFDDVTYGDVDKRAAKFFADRDGVQQIIKAHRGNTDTAFRFIPGDYRALELEPQSVDLLISLYAGLISEACGHFLAIGGTLLVNSSHGDAAMAALDPRFELAGAVVRRGEGYGVSTRGLAGYMIPGKPQTITADSIRKAGRGIAYTRSPFAYLFRRVG